jgi:hypothetical protein
VSSAITLGEQFIYVANRRLSALIGLACEVGGELARDDAENDLVARLREFDETAYPGIDFHLDEVFSTSSEKKWWARVFHLVARRVFLRGLEDQAIVTWQPSLIGDAYVVARMLTHAVQQVEPGWHPTIDDPTESPAYTSGPIRVRY